MFRKISFVSVMVLATVIPGTTATAQEINGQVNLEGRMFPESGLFEEQHSASGSASLELEIFWQSRNNRHEFVVTPFVRMDVHDSRRNLVDFREGFWQYVARNWEVRTGFATVFWGVAESQHLVDIINQTDYSDRPDGESKLGQPMVHFTYIGRAGSVELFALPFFRERTFVGEQGRLRFPFAVVGSRKLQAGRTDVAVRWSRPFRLLDVGVSHYWGTSREPRFDVRTSGEGQAPEIAPIYETIHQTGLDAQATFAGWLLKLEAISRSGQGEWFTASTAGFEYTFSNLRNSGIDLGLLAEFHYDSREPVQLGLQSIGQNPLDKDIFVGSRLALNDVNGTEILGGAIIDADTASSMLFVEGSRRVGRNFRLTAEFRGFANADSGDILYSFRNDSYAQIGLSYFFSSGR